MTATLNGLELYPPWLITARLMPGVKVGDAFISIEMPCHLGADGRRLYTVFIDMADGREFEIDDLRSGVGGGSLAQGMAALLSFLGAAAESYRYRLRTGREGENEQLFVHELVVWASENADEIAMLGEIEEGG